jgi:hypothetical protein
MTDDELIELAYQANLPFWRDSEVPIHMNELRKFAELVVQSQSKRKVKNSKHLCGND